MGAVVHERSSGALTCPLLDDFENVEAIYEKSRDRLLAYIAQVANAGPQTLNTAQCHVVDAKHKIYEFIAGQLRVLFFQGPTGRVVVCSHMLLKKTQKTPEQEVKKAIRAKNSYEAAEQAGLVEWRNEL